MRSTVLFVSSGLLAPKKTDHPFARRHRYLNYGMLTLATLLHEEGHSVRLFHGSFSPPEEFAQRLTEEYLDCIEFSLWLSLPSYFAIGWAQRFLRQLRSKLPNVKIVVGGRWVVGEDGEWIRRKLPEADLVVYGTAESRAEALLDASRWAQVPYTDRSLLPTSPEPWNRYVDLRYELMDDYSDFTPSIEVSRGCGMGCTFCEERGARLTSIRAPKSVLAAMQKSISLYGDPALHFYLEASWFVPSASWARQFATEYIEHDLRTVWRCETRVDTVQIAALEDLVRSGLRVIDLGLESASSTQLIRMNKTRDPVQYLKRASALLQKCHDLGVWAKVNLMLYAGESAETLNHSLDWLEQHRTQIKGVSVSPVVLYGHGSQAKQYLEHLAALGATPVDSGSTERNGFAHLHLSREFDHDRVRALSVAIAKEFMSDRDYYDLKSFSYFPRSYTYKSFREDLSGSDDRTLPFRVLNPDEVYPKPGRSTNASV
jgi:radical SAM superfamily enzyme YgiQ (UPF0313 family)